MIKIEAITLEDAYSQAAKQLDCSVTELTVEVVQYPSNGILGLFRKKAIIVASLKQGVVTEPEEELQEPIKEPQEEELDSPEVAFEEESTSFVTQQEYEEEDCETC